MGTLHAAMLGLFTVADIQGGGEIAGGEMMCYFAGAVDDRPANATLEDGPISLTVQV